MSKTTGSTPAMLYAVTMPQALDDDVHMRLRIADITDAIADALHDAHEAGVVVEVTLDPGIPLAQGNYTPHIRIRERKDLGMAREAAACKAKS